MSSPFSVQPISKGFFSKTVHNHQPSPIHPVEIEFDLGECQLLNYNSEYMLETVQLFFEDEQFRSYAEISQIVQILALSVNDSEMIQQLESIVCQNSMKKELLYIFCCLWSQKAPLNKLVSKFSLKGSALIVHNVISTYLCHNQRHLFYYEQQGLNDQIIELLVSFCGDELRIWKEIEADVCDRYAQSKSEFQKRLSKLIEIIQELSEQNSSSSQIEHQSQFKLCSKTLQICLKFVKNNQKFITQEVRAYFQKSKDISCVALLSRLIQTKKSILNSDSSIGELQKIVDSQIKEQLTDFDSMKVISNLFMSSQTTLEAVEDYESQSQTVKNLYMNTIAKVWCQNGAHMLWNLVIKPHLQLFSFGSSQQSKDQIQKRTFLVDFLLQLIKSKHRADFSQQCLTKMCTIKFFYHFFESRPFNLVAELQYSQSQQEFQQIIKPSLKLVSHMKNQGKLNILMINCSSFKQMSIWGNTGSNFQDDLEYLLKFKSLRPVIEQLKQNYSKLQEKCLKNNKKISLRHSVVHLKIDQKDCIVAVQQLKQILSSGTQQLDILKGNNNETLKQYYQKQYEVFGVSGQQNSQETTYKADPLHPIIIEAKVVKLMKKELKEARKSQIAQKIGVPLEKVQPIIIRLIKKGYLEEDTSKGVLTYEP